MPLDGSAALAPLTPSPRTRSGVHRAAGGSFEPQAAPLAAEWPPEHVRGDGEFVTVDAGCGWLHSAKRNPWTRIAEATGVTIDRSSPNWGVQWRDLGFPPHEQRAFGEAYDRFETAAHAALDGPDRPLLDFVAPDDPWRPMIDAISGYANGAPLGRVSLHDWAAYEDAATEDNWALPAGYGTLIVGHARGVPIRLDTPVTRIDHRGTRIRLDTPAGTIDAARVILALPTTAYGGLVFDPPLPDKQQAAANLPLGLADKVFLAVDTPEWPAHAHLTGDPHSACTASHRLSPFGLPIIESFFGGACAEAMADELSLDPAWLNSRAFAFLAGMDDEQDAEAALLDFPGHRIRVASPRYLLAMKIAAMRAKDVDDAAACVRYLGYRDADAIVTEAIAILGPDSMAWDAPHDADLHAWLLPEAERVLRRAWSGDALWDDASGGRPAQ